MGKLKKGSRGRNFFEERGFGQSRGFYDWGLMMVVLQEVSGCDAGTMKGVTAPLTPPYGHQHSAFSIPPVFSTGEGHQNLSPLNLCGKDPSKLCGAPRKHQRRLRRQVGLRRTQSDKAHPHNPTRHHRLCFPLRTPTPRAATQWLVWSKAFLWARGATSEGSGCCPAAS